MPFLTSIILIFFILGLLLFVCSCGQNQNNTPSGNPNLKIVTFEASATTFTATISNVGSAAAGKFIVKFWLDEIYDGYPTSKSTTLEGLAAGAVITVETTNTLTAGDGKGEHYVTVKADSSSAITEDDESNNAAYATYYDGSYATAYNSVRGNISTWRSEAKTLCQSYFGFSPSENYSTHLVDSTTDESGDLYGRAAIRYLSGSEGKSVIFPTRVVLLNLKYVNSGYPTFKYDNVTYESNSSREVVLHEYVHAYHWEYVAGKGGYSQWDSVPTWFGEGLAVYGSGQRSNKVKSLMAGHMGEGYNTLQTTTAYVMQGLKTGTAHGSVNYAEDYLAIQYIIDTFGLSALQNVIRDNSTSTNMTNAILGNLTGVSSWSDFEDVRVYNYGTAEVADYYPHIPRYPFN